MVIPRPSPGTLTLRLKNHRTTVCLYSTPTTSFNTIKAELLSALHATNTDGALHGNTIPSDPDDVLFAHPVDPANLDLGWVSLDQDDEDGADENGDDMFGGEEAGSSKKAKGKGKATKQKLSFKHCPQGAGLKDNAIIAFKFVNAAPVVPQPQTSKAGLGLDEGFVDEDDDEPPQQEVGDRSWDVVMPAFEDTYGIGDLLPDDEVLTPKANKFVDYDDL